MIESSNMLRGETVTEYGNMTLDEYRDALASSNPTPGGGTAAAVALAQGAALTVMVCNLTEGKEKWNAGWDAALVCRNIATPLLELSHKLASKDAHSFDDVMLAFKLPKETDLEKQLRKNAIHEGTLKAAKVPLETAKHAYSLLQTLPELATHGNGNAVTDVGVAGLLVSAACKGALFNVEINLNSLPEDMGIDLRSELESIRSDCRDKSRELMHAVHDRMQA